MIKQVTKTILLISIPILLNACSLPSSQIPADHYYRLPSIKLESEVQPVFKQLLIAPVQVSGLYHERAILYIEQAQPLEIKRYHYHYWVEPPAKLIRSYLATYLQQSSIAEQITTDAGFDKADVEVRSVLKSFERLVNDSGFEVVVKIQVTIEYADESWPVKIMDYPSRTAAASASMHDTAAAFGEALQEIARQLSQDILVKKSKD